jgi:hypothetical protein
MNCGKVAWWREPDIVGLLEYHGVAEHLVIQLDFIAQVQRLGRSEYSIPGASKTRNGETGYADLVSIASGEIWEIKPRHLEHIAFEEAAYYVKHARRSCGPQWRPGFSYAPSNTFGGGGVVYRLEGQGNKAELIAEQGKKGTIRYYWRINGDELSKLVPYFAWAIRQEIVRDYYTAGQPPQPLPGSKAPDNFPPGKFKPPVLTPDACIPQLAKFVPTLMKSILTTCQQTVLENSSIGVLLEARIFNALVGPGLVANQISMLKVKPPDPMHTLQREALAVLTAAGAAHGLVGLAIGLTGALYFTIEGAVLVGGVVIVPCEAASIATAPAFASEGLLGTFVASVRAAEALRTPVAAGAALLAFATPRASSANPREPVAIDVSFPKFVVFKPNSGSARLGQSMTIDGGEWIIAGLARTLPD